MVDRHRPANCMNHLPIIIAIDAINRWYFKGFPNCLVQRSMNIQSVLFIPYHENQRPNDEEWCKDKGATARASRPIKAAFEASSVGVSRSTVTDYSFVHPVGEDSFQWVPIGVSRVATACSVLALAVIFLLKTKSEHLLELVEDT